MNNQINAVLIALAIAVVLYLVLSLMGNSCGPREFLADVSGRGSGERGGGGGGSSSSSGGSSDRGASGRASGEARVVSNRGSTIGGGASGRAYGGIRGNSVYGGASGRVFGDNTNRSTPTSTRTTTNSSSSSSRPPSNRGAPPNKSNLKEFSNKFYDKYKNVVNTPRKGTQYYDSVGRLIDNRNIYYYDGGYYYRPYSYALGSNFCSNCETIAPDQCSSCENCGNCLTIDTNGNPVTQCVSGDENGPYSDSCNDWDFNGVNYDSYNPYYFNPNVGQRNVLSHV